MAQEEQNEEQEFIIADKRKFNLDGSLRDGATIAESKPQPAPTAEKPPISRDTIETQSAATSQTAFANADSSADLTAEAGQTDDDQEFDETNIPGAEDPASFANFVLSLASQAAAALGMSENPAGGQVRVDLNSGKYLIDVLGMLQEKTKNNLHPLEQKLFSQLLGELRMQFVQIQRLAEEQRRRQEDQLLKNAQQKFTGKDILGK